MVMNGGHYNTINRFIFNSNAIYLKVLTWHKTIRDQ